MVPEKPGNLIQVVNHLMVVWVEGLGGREGVGGRGETGLQCLGFVLSKKTVQVGQQEHPYFREGPLLTVIIHCYW